MVQRKGSALTAKSYSAILKNDVNYARLIRNPVVKIAPFIAISRNTEKKSDK